MTPHNETAARSSQLRDGGKTDQLGSVSYLPKYTAAALSSMPSAEVAGKVALVVARGGKLFLVGAYPAGGAL